MKIFLLFEINFKIKTPTDLNRFLESTYLSINFFSKSLEYLRASDQTFALEYGSFLYQLSSFCSRQVKMAKLVPDHFSSESIERKLSEKKIEFLKMSLAVYLKSSESLVATTSEQTRVRGGVDETSHTVDAGESSSSIDNKNENSESGSRQPASNRGTTTQTASSNSEEWGEEWLHHYMFGKIKEKLNYPLLECLEHYKKVQSLSIS